jgi:hypothetical protein
MALPKRLYLYMNMTRYLNSKSIISSSFKRPPKDLRKSLAHLRDISRALLLTGIDIDRSRTTIEKVTSHVHVVMVGVLPRLEHSVDHC